LLVACSSKPKKQPATVKVWQSDKPEAVAEAKPEPVAPIEAAPPPQIVVAPPPPPVVQEINDPMLSLRSVYYPLDVSVVQPGDRMLVDAHAHYLSAHPEKRVRLEGNCDERGSNEYNLALGQRRSDGVKRLLMTSGVVPSQIDSISNGEEQPRLTCHNESCWKENRRTDIFY
jgi:peptidoglycan-associated lipoprotein